MCLVFWSNPTTSRVTPGPVRRGHCWQGLGRVACGVPGIKTRSAFKAIPSPHCTIFFFFSVKDLLFYFLLKRRDLWTGELVHKRLSTYLLLTANPVQRFGSTNAALNAAWHRASKSSDSLTPNKRDMSLIPSEKHGDSFSANILS